MRTEELDYQLPPNLIATVPAEPRDTARLLVIDRASRNVYHHQVKDLPRLAEKYPGAGLPAAGDLMIVNETRVLPAYFTGSRHGTGGKITGLFLGHAKQGDSHWRVMLESRGKLQEGEIVDFGEHGHLKLIQKRGGGEWDVLLESEHQTLALLSMVGSPPLPPYIRKQRQHEGADPLNADDVSRYNTVYAGGDDKAGSVAAPTAGLHFTPSLLAELSGLGIHRAQVTLHVGLGTFSPIRSELLKDHQLHTEAISVPAETLKLINQTRKNSKRIIPVGTTSVRTLESLSDDIVAAEKGFEGETDLYVMPNQGFKFRFTDSLMTNFHLPKSSLIALVASLPGVSVKDLLGWYDIAIQEEYRFYSYGDAMLIV